MKILVTGAAGFIGFHLIKFLLSEGNDIVGIDNLCSSHMENVSKLARIAERYQSSTFSFLIRDVRDDHEISRLGKFDEIYNLACPASPKWYQADPLGTMLTSILGVKNLLDLAYSNADCGFFQASTSEVYGNPMLSPQPESYWGNVNPCGIRSCYDEGKRAAEAYIFDFHRVNPDQKIAVGRIFNTYGPNMLENDGRVISNFILQALRSEPLTVYGVGEQTRSLCYVEDTVKGIVAVMRNSPNTPVNIGSDEEMTILELAKEVISLTDSKSIIIFENLPTDDPVRRKANNWKLRQMNWEQKVPLEAGLNRTIEYFKENLK